MKKRLSILLLTATLFACKKESTTQFTQINPKQSNIDFKNTLRFDEDFNIYTYRNFYNGGGVAIGDLNNDGLNDIYFTANMNPNELYINQGDFHFKPVGETAGVQGTKAWSTGVSLVDINADGWLDIYVCNSGDVNGDDKQNELFVNNQDGTFSEQAQQYGLADQGFSTHAAFFDYDHDGDLDCYLLNNSYRSIGSFNLRRNERNTRDKEGGDKLFRNDNGHFVDVSDEAGIYGSVIGFGLGVTVGDINRDGWEDIFVSNDFFERDYLYINQKNGTFKEELPQWMNSTSAASMGADLADLNNDLWPDLFVTEMLPEGNDRIKTKTTFESWDNYQFKLKNDYYHQFTRNMLQINKRDSQFAEVSRYAGVSATDWSWAALGADFDLDGNKEIFIANGIYQDLTDQDFIMYASSDEARNMVRRGHKEDFERLIEIIPSVPISNYLFHQDGELHYTNLAEDWGLATPSHSNGSAYGDLDNDGDLDLVVNNVNANSFIYRNNEKEHKGTQSVSIRLKGGEANPLAYGAKIFVLGDKKQLYELMPIRGFQSTMAPEIIIPKAVFPENHEFFVQWPTGTYSKHKVTEWDKIMVLSELENNEIVEQPELYINNPAPSLANQLRHHPIPLGISHQENVYSDFDQTRLIYAMTSRMGPKLAVGDLNGDGLDDFYLCGAKGQEGQLYYQNADGQFRLSPQKAFALDKNSEDVDAQFIDVDNDGDLDLYVVSGGSEFNAFSTELIDRLYINNNNHFTKSKEVYPVNNNFVFGSCVAKADINQDGYDDLFIGSRQQADYGVPATSYLLLNNQNGGFTLSEQNELKEIGMVTDAEFVNLDGDPALELVVVGEYMPVRIFDFDNSVLTPKEGDQNQLKGWWNSVEAVDRNHDGQLDLLLANHGQNSRFKATKEQPVRIYVNDFDQNGTVEQVITVFNNGVAYPLGLRHDLVMQMPYLKNEFLKYADYENATITDLFTEAQLEHTLILEANELRSGYLMNTDQGFQFEPLQTTAQLSCVNALAHVDDVVFMGGNQDGVKPEVGRQDASSGFAFSLSQDHLSFDDELGISGVVNDIKVLKAREGYIVLFARNNDQLLAYAMQ